MVHCICAMVCVSPTGIPVHTNTCIAGTWYNRKSRKSGIIGVKRADNFLATASFFLFLGYKTEPTCRSADLTPLAIGGKTDGRAPHAFHPTPLIEKKSASTPLALNQSFDALPFWTRYDVATPGLQYRTPERENEQ